MTKLGRNKPCWCGSGLKYKLCHLDRERQDPPTLEEAITAIDRSKKGYCLHPEASVTECKGKIVRSHSIQRRGGLERIARNGHVYQYPMSLAGLLKARGTVTPSLVGIRNASVFTGFCARHDSETFVPIDTQPFSGTIDQCFLVAYRALARELYAKRHQAEMLPYQSTLDKGVPLPLQVDYQKDFRIYSKGVTAGLSDTELRKAEFDRALISRDFSPTKYYVIQFDTTPDFLCSGGVAIQSDFQGNVLQGVEEFWDTSRSLEYTTYSLLTTPTGGAAVFCWIGHSINAFKFVKSLHSLSDSAIPHALTRFTFEFFENISIRPEWWEGLDEPSRSAIQARTAASFSLTAERVSDCLLDDGLRLVDWGVTSRNTNLDF